MLFARAISITIVLVALFLAGSCVEDKDYGESSNLRPNVNRNVEVNTNANIAEDSEEKLDEFINLPLQPEENVFREEPVSAAGNSNQAAGATGKQLTIVLRYTEENTEELVRMLSKQKPAFKTEVATESWFPAELKAKSETSGNQQLKGTGYSAAQFAKAPWSKGSIIRIDDTKYFVLMLQTN